MKLSIPKKTKLVSYISAGISILFVIASLVFGILSSSSEKSYKSLLLAEENCGFSNVVYGPSKEQITELNNIDGVDSVNPMYLIERDVDFSEQAVNLFALDGLDNNGSLKSTLFQNVLSGDDELNDNEIYFDKFLFDSSDLFVGQTVTINFGKIDRTYVVGGVVSPIHQVLTIKTEGVCFVKYDSAFDTAFSDPLKISCATVNGNSAALTSYLSGFRSLGMIDSFAVFNTDYRTMHSQGTYTDDEYAQVIQAAYDAYYQEEYNSLSTGQYKTSSVFFRNMVSASYVKKAKNDSKTQLIVANVLMGLGFIPIVIGLFLNLNEEKKSVQKEGVMFNFFAKYNFLNSDLPYVSVILASIITLFIVGAVNSKTIVTLGSQAYRIPFIGLLVSVICLIIFRVVEQSLVDKKSRKDVEQVNYITDQKGKKK